MLVGMDCGELRILSKPADNLRITINLSHRLSAPFQQLITSLSTSKLWTKTVLSLVFVCTNVLGRKSHLLRESLSNARDVLHDRSFLGDELIELTTAMHDGCMVTASEMRTDLRK